MRLWRGWIVGKKEDKTLLEQLDITIAKEKSEINGKIEFEVDEITDEALDKLDPYWGRLIWGLEPYEGVWKNT